MAVPRRLERPTFGLGSRFAYRFVNDLQPDVANVLHPFPCLEILFRRPKWCGIANAANVTLSEIPRLTGNERGRELRRPTRKV